MALESGELGATSSGDFSSKIVAYQERMRALVAEILSYTRVALFDYTDADAYIAGLKQRLRKRPRFDEEITHWAFDVLETDDRLIEAEAGIPNEEEKVKDLIALVDERADRKFGTLIRAIEQSKYSPAEPGALVCEPLKAALRGR